MRVFQPLLRPWLIISTDLPALLQPTSKHQPTPAPRSSCPFLFDCIPPTHTHTHSQAYAEYGQEGIPSKGRWEGPPPAILRSEKRERQRGAVSAGPRGPKVSALRWEPRLAPTSLLGGGLRDGLAPPRTKTGRGGRRRPKSAADCGPTRQSGPRVGFGIGAAAFRPPPTLSSSSRRPSSGSV